MDRLQEMLQAAVKHIQNMRTDHDYHAACVMQEVLADINYVLRSELEIGIKPIELAELLQISEQQLDRILSGDPSAVTLEVLARFVVLWHKELRIRRLI